MQVTTQRTSAGTYLRIQTAATDMSVLLDAPTREAAQAAATEIKNRAVRMLERAALIETAALQLKAV
jgi:hypothetical protein